MSSPDFTLSALLVCAACDQRLHPLRLAGGQRAYRSPCGCRLHPVDAATAERLVLDALDARGLLPSGAPIPHDTGPLFRRSLAEIRVGAVADDIAYIWRI